MGNNTKIKYLNVEGKVYEVTRISFFYMSIEASETDLTINDLPKCELWDLAEFKRYKVRLINNGGKAEIVDFEKFRNNRQ